MCRRCGGGLLRAAGAGALQAARQRRPGAVRVADGAADAARRHAVRRLRGAKFCRRTDRRFLHHSGQGVAPRNRHTRRRQPMPRRCSRRDKHKPPVPPLPPGARGNGKHHSHGSRSVRPREPAGSALGDFGSQRCRGIIVRCTGRGPHGRFRA